jgi:hypothetical protein
VPQLVGEDRCNSEQFREVLHAGTLRCSTVQCSVYLRYCAALCLSFFLSFSAYLLLSLSLSLSLSSPNKPLSDWLCVCPPPLLSPTMLFFLSLSSLYPFQSFSAYYSNKSKYSIVYFYCEIFLLQISQISPSKFDRNYHESISARYLYCKSTGTSPVQITPGSWVK